MFAAIYQVRGLETVYPVGLYPTSKAAQAACVRKARSFQSVTLGASDFDWQGYTDEGSRAIAGGFEFTIRKVVRYL